MRIRTFELLTEEFINVPLIYYIFNAPRKSSALFPRNHLVNLLLIKYGNESFILLNFSEWFT